MNCNELARIDCNPRIRSKSLMAKPLLAEDLKRRFKERGYSVAAGARALGLSENSLRSWMRRNRYPVEQLEVIAKFLDLPTELAELARSFRFEVAREKLTYGRRLGKVLDDECPGLDEVLELLSTQWTDSVPSHSVRNNELRSLIRSLGDGDLYVHCSFDQIPYEMEASSLAAFGEDVARAVQRGAKFVYLHVGSDLVSRARESGIHHVVLPETFYEICETFQKRVSGFGSLDRKAISRSIISIACNESLFFTPGLPFVLIKPHADVGHPATLFVRHGLRSGDMPFHVPLNPSTTNAFLTFLAGVVDASQYSVIDVLLS